MSPSACDDVAECQLRITGCSSVPAVDPLIDLVYDTVSKRQLTKGTIYVRTKAMYTSHILSQHNIITIFIIYIY